MHTTPIRTLASKAKKVLRSREGAIDLAAIMVGVVVIGIASSSASATTFTVVPWSQEQAAAAELGSVATAQSVAYGFNTSYRDFGTLVDDGLIENTDSVDIAIGEDGRCFIATTVAPSGVTFYGSSKSAGVESDKDGPVDTSWCVPSEAAPVVATAGWMAAMGRMAEFSTTLHINTTPSAAQKKSYDQFLPFLADTGIFTGGLTSDYAATIKGVPVNAAGAGTVKDWAVNLTPSGVLTISGAPVPKGTDAFMSWWNSGSMSMTDTAGRVNTIQLEHSVTRANCLVKPPGKPTSSMCVYE